jgi:RNA polymerase sigma factor (sigma-70 family)
MSELNDLIDKYQGLLRAEKLELMRLPAVKKRMIEWLWELQKPERQRRISAKTLAALVVRLSRGNAKPEEYFRSLEALRLNLEIWNSLRREAEEKQSPEKSCQWRLAHNTANEARNEILLLTLDLVHLVGVSFSPANEHIREDLESCGLLGLIKAIDLFDSRYKREFKYYARTWISSYMIEHIQRSKTVTPSVQVTRLLHQYEKKINELSGKLGRAPEDDEIAQAMDLDPTELQQLKDKKISMISFDAPIQLEDADETSMHEVLGAEASRPYENIERRQVVERLVECLHKLHPQEAHVLSMYLEIGSPKPIKGKPRSLKDAFATMAEVAAGRLKDALQAKA